ncbi:early endosome antigen 1-like [Antennarius striatus]|uniref:early endosome antigen 1-like n=1 Tax=Antennarius striatus TaxID=241820 RepID=UPI0035AE0B5E
MSQKSTTEPGVRLKLSDQGSVTVNGSTRGRGTETNSIKLLLSEVKELHEQRFRCLDLDASMTQEELLQRKVIFLHCYVSDLTDQNQLLLQTIEDQQNKADGDVSSWVAKRHTSDRGLKGPEDDMKTLHLDDLVGPTAHLIHSEGSLVEIAFEIEDLKIQLKTKDLIISDLERELAGNDQKKRELQTATRVLQSSERLLHLQSELTCLQQIQKDNMKEIAEKDIRITKLQAIVQVLQQEDANTHVQLSKLRLRAKELHDEMGRKDEGCRQKEKEQRLKYEKHHQKAEERRLHEQHKREEEKWARRVEEERKRDDDWKRAIEEEREAHAETVKTDMAATLTSEAEAKMVALRGELNASFDMKLEEKEIRITLLTKELDAARQQVKDKEDHVRHLGQDVVVLRATEDSLKRTLAMKETHTQQLVQDNKQLKESLVLLQSKLQTSDCTMSDITKSLDQTKTALNTERQQREQMQDQLSHANKEMERLQQELTHVRHTTEKKIQKREVKMRMLLRELTERKKQHSECQNELLLREAASEKLCLEKDELRACMEGQSRECVQLSCTKDGLEADLALCQEKLRTSQLEVQSRDQLILQLRSEMKTAKQKHRKKQEQVAELEGEVGHLKQNFRRHHEEACQLREKVRVVECLKDQKGKEQQQLHDQLHLSQQQVETFKEKLKNQENEMELLHQQLKEGKEELIGANSQAQGHKEDVDIFKHKYIAAIEKVHKVQGQVELLQEELLYVQQQLRGSQLATDTVKEELNEVVKQYQHKVVQWENSQETLYQLTDELQTNQNLFRESQQKEDHLQGLIGTLQEQVDTLKKQKLTLEYDLRIYKQRHSHSDEEYHSLLQRRQHLQKSCTEQVERLAECEKAILQMKSELERQAQEKAVLKQSLIESHHKHTSNHNQMEQEVLHLKKEVTSLELELADARKVHETLLRQSEEELMEAHGEAARSSRELAVQKEAVQRIHIELQKQKEQLRSSNREKQSLGSHVTHLKQELKELLSKHKVTVEELAACAEEARQMEGRLDEGKLAEGKIRSMAVRLETEAAELRRNLQQAVDHKLKAEQEKRDAQDQVAELRSVLEGTQSDNAKLLQESQLVMTNVNHWIAEQKTSNETLTTRINAQNKMLLIITNEKVYLQEANDTLKAEVRRLKEVVDEKARVTERLKAEVREGGIRQDDRTEKHGCVARNLSKIEDIQTKLQHNLEAIGILNQQLNALSGENKWLRRQLEEERSMRLRPPPPTSQQHSSIHLPFSLSARPPPPSTFLPASFRLPHQLIPGTSTSRDVEGTEAHAKLTSGTLVRTGESRASVEALRIRPTASASLEDASSGATSRDLTK